MKETHGWLWPDHEQHMIKWMDSPKNRIKMNGRWTYQGVKQKLLLRFCRSFDTVIDVGAHVGLWSYNFAFHFERVEAFEPIAAHRECFRKNVTQDNVVLHACALGAKNDSISMATEQGSSGNSTVAGVGDIPMETLDSFGFEKVSAVKLDCEGFEENVLRGGEKTILKYMPTIIVEQKRDMATRFGLQKLGAVGYLKSLGYEVVQEYSGDFIMNPK